MSDVTEDPPAHHSGTIDPGTFGATPSSADELIDGPAPGTPIRVGKWPMWLLGLVIMIDQVDQNVLRGAAPDMQKSMHLSDFQIGILLSCFIAVNGLISVPAGYLADRWNRTRTVGHTIIAWSGISALTAAAPNYGVLVAIRSALGFGQAITEPSAASLLADYYPSEQRGTAFSIQQCLVFMGFGLGIGLGGVVASALGWRWAFLIVGTPGVVIALAVYRLWEPPRGHGDRLHLGISPTGEDEVEVTQGLFDDGIKQFLVDMLRGLRADLRTIWSITTMKFALVGVSALLFSVTAVGAALPFFYERQLHVAKGTAEVYVGLILIVGGVPGVLLGGPLADRFAGRLRGGRMAIPGFCVLAGEAVFVLSYLKQPFATTFGLEVLGAFIITLAVPALRAGFSDAIPANLRGAGFGAFNLVSVILGQAAASVVVLGLAGALHNNYRLALLLVSPPVFLGGFIFLKARDHLDEDAAKIFQAIITAMQEQQAADAAKEAKEAGAATGANPEEIEP